MSGCIAFAGAADIIYNYLGIVVSVIAKGLLGAADIVLEPLLEITTMSTADVSRFVPGFDNGNNIGNFFIQAINIIAYMIAGVLICCHIISYLINLAHGEKVESIPKLIWNAVFGIVMVICGKTFLTMIFNEIVAPLSSALTEGVSDAGGTFSFSSVGSDMTGLGEITSAFDLNSLATLIVVLALMLIIWWNLIKLVLECAERYIICIFTINLSPLAFATMASENTKDTAANWLKMFWSQCVLLILNIWVVGIARTALNNSLIGATNTEMVKWGLITYAYIKIAQRLDDMMQTAGLRITRTTGLDPISEASGLMRSVKGVFGDVASIAGHVAGVGRNAMDAGKEFSDANNFHPIQNFKQRIGGGEVLALGDGHSNNSSYSNRSKAEKVLGSETCAERKAKIEKGTLKNDSYDTDAYRQLMEDKLRDAGRLDDDTHVESVKIGDDGELYANAVKRDEKGRVSEMTNFEVEETQDGTADIEGAKKLSSVQVAPGGKSAMEKDNRGDGTFGIRKVGEDAAGNQEWEVEHIANRNGDKVKDIAPGVDNKVRFTVPASKIAEGRKNKNSDAMTAYNYCNAQNDSGESIKSNLTAKVNKAMQDQQKRDMQEQSDMTNLINMTDKGRLADVMDRNADYNSPNALKAMEKHIMENAQYYPEQAAFLANGGHVVGISVSDGKDGNPAGALVVDFLNDQDGKNSKATCVFTRDEELDDDNTKTGTGDGGEPKSDAQNESGDVKPETPPTSVSDTTPVVENAQAPAPQDIGDNTKTGTGDGGEPKSDAQKDDTKSDSKDDAELEHPPTDGTGYYQEGAHTNSFTTSEQGKSESEPEQTEGRKRPPIPKVYTTFQSSVKRLSDTNGTVESEDLGMFQMTREAVAEDGWTTWRILQKVDSDGNTPEYAPFKVHIKPVWDRVTKKPRPATFDEVANKARNIKGFENVGPDLDADYRKRKTRRGFNK